MAREGIYLGRPQNLELGEFTETYGECVCEWVRRGLPGRPTVAFVALQADVPLSTCYTYMHRLYQFLAWTGCRWFLDLDSGEWRPQPLDAA